MARVVIENLTKVFAGPGGQQVRAVDGISLTVEDEEFLTVVGPSGCGKTTTLRLIAGLEEATEGIVSIDGQVVNHVAPKDRDIAMVFQSPALYPHMTAYENLAFGLKLRRCSKTETEKRVKEAAEMLGLCECLERLPKELSGGQQQRVAVGRALVRRPKVFLFDEPLSNLDAQMRVQMRAELARLHRQIASTMIYVTHDQVEAMTLGHRIAVMNRGRIEQVAAPMKIYAQPANLFVAGFMGSPMNLFKGSLANNGRELCFIEQNAGGSDPANKLVVALEERTVARLRPGSGNNVILGVRPEDISVASSAVGTPAGNIMEGVIEVIQPIGAEMDVYVRRKKDLLVVRTKVTEELRVNDRVPLVFASHQVHWFAAVDGRRL